MKYFKLGHGTYRLNDTHILERAADGDWIRCGDQTVEGLTIITDAQAFERLLKAGFKLKIMELPATPATPSRNTFKLVGESPADRQLIRTSDNRVVTPTDTGLRQLWGWLLSASVKSPTIAREIESFANFSSGNSENKSLFTP